MLVKNIMQTQPEKVADELYIVIALKNAVLSMTYNQSVVWFSCVVNQVPATFQ